MSFELEKQLGIQRKLVADLESKNRLLLLRATALDNKMAGLEEQLTIKDSVYEAKIKELTSVIATHVRQVQLTYLLNEDLKKEKKMLQEKHKALVSDLNERIATQDTVIQDLTDDLLRANRDNGRLEAKMEKVEKENRIYKKLEQEIKKFE